MLLGSVRDVQWPVGFADIRWPMLLGRILNVLLMAEIRLTGWYVVYPIIYKVCGAGFLPSTVLYGNVQGFSWHSLKYIVWIGLSWWTLFAKGKFSTCEEHVFSSSVQGTVYTRDDCIFSLKVLDCVSCISQHLHHGFTNLHHGFTNLHHGFANFFTIAASSWQSKVPPQSYPLPRNSRP